MTKFTFYWKENWNLKGKKRKEDNNLKLLDSVDGEFFGREQQPVDCLIDRRTDTASAFSFQPVPILVRLLDKNINQWIVRWSVPNWYVKMDIPAQPRFRPVPVLERLLDGNIQLLVCLTDRRMLQHLTVSNRFLFSPRASFGRVNTDQWIFWRTTGLHSYGFVDRWFLLLARRFAFRPGRPLVGEAGKKKKEKKNCSLFVSLCCESSAFLCLLKRFASDSTSRRFVWDFRCKKRCPLATGTTFLSGPWGARSPLSTAIAGGALIYIYICQHFLAFWCISFLYNPPDFGVSIFIFILVPFFFSSGLSTY